MRRRAMLALVLVSPIGILLSLALAANAAFQSPILRVTAAADAAGCNAVGRRAAVMGNGDAFLTDLQSSLSRIRAQSSAWDGAEWTSSTDQQFVTTSQSSWGIATEGTRR